MKKIMIFLICIVSVLISLSFAMFEKTQDDEHLGNIELIGEFTKFYVTKSNVKTDNELLKFHELSDKYGASFMRNDVVFENEETIVYKSGVFSEEYLKLLCDKIQIDTVLEKPSDFWATFKTSSPNQVGQIKDLFQDFPLVLKSLDSHYDSTDFNTNGVYTLIVSEEKTNEVLKELSLLYDISVEELLTPTSGFEVEIGTFFYIFLFLLVIIILIYILVITFYPISKIKEIGVMKIMGYKNSSIWRELTSRILFASSIFFLLSLLIQLFIIEGVTASYIIRLSILHLVIFSIFSFVSLIMLYFIRQFDISLILKKMTNLRIPLAINYTVKFIVYAGLIFIIPMLVSSIKSLVNEYAIKSVYEQEKTFVTLSSINYRNEQVGSLSLEKNLINLFHELEQTANAQYIVAERYYPSKISADLGFKNNEFVNVVQANQNYLQYMDLPISFEKAFSEDNLSVYIPESAQSKRIEEFTYSLLGDFIQGADTGGKPLEDLVKIHYYPDNNVRIFSRNLDMLDIDRGFMKNPVFFCMADYYLTEVNSYLQNSALSNPIRISNTKENLSAIDVAIKNNNLEENKLEFQSVLESGFAEKLQMSKAGTVIWLIIILLAILVSIFSSYYIILMIMISRRKEIVVSTLLGFSFFDKYKNEISNFGMIYLFGFIELLLISRNLIALSLFSLITIVDMGIVYFLVKKYENQSLNLSIKGEE